ncbi:hypothetical protein ACDT10_21575 [Mycobacterium intracellulare]|uniref:hypothetical protein n=1 Tax=Mycobacterium intracellulare TaxID=1767 RepID=UPI003556880E
MNTNNASALRRPLVSLNIRGDNAFQRLHRVYFADFGETVISEFVGRGAKVMTSRVGRNRC